MMYMKFHYDYKPLMKNYSKSNCTKSITRELLLKFCTTKVITKIIVLKYEKRKKFLDYHQTHPIC